MSDSLKMRPLELHEYMASQVWKDISHRFYERHGIRIAGHIKHMLKVERGIGQGITFVPKDFRKLTREIMATGEFAHDDREHLIDRAAAAVTKGEGYREIGEVSLHVAIAEQRCNIHIDDYGFEAVGPDGTKYKNPEMLQHIADDLGVGYLREFFNANFPKVGWALERTHLKAPNALNRYRVGYGVQLDIARGRSNSSEKRWKLSVDFDHSCRDRWCAEREKTIGVNLTIGRTPSDTTNSNLPPRR